MTRLLTLVVMAVLGLVDSTPAMAGPAPAPRARVTVEKTVPSLRKSKPILSFDTTRATDVLYLVGGTIHTGNGTVIEDGVVKIVGARIDGVDGPGAKAGVPADAPTVDCTGKIVTPGLIAADTSIGLVEIGGEPSTRDDGREDEHPIRAGYDASTAINSMTPLFQVNAIEGVTSAAVSPRGGLISGQVAWVDLLEGARDAVARRRVAVDASMGQSYGGSRAATLAKLRQTLTDARFYRARRAAHDRRQLRELAAHPFDLAALGPVLDRQVPLVISADRASDILAVLDLARELGIHVVILGGTQAWRVADELAAADVVVIVEPSSNLPRSFDTMGARLDNAALLARAGVRVGIASLGGAHNLRTVTQQAGIAVANGLDRATALRAVTLTIAEAYGMAEHYGSIAPGKVANVVVWNGDPFELSRWPSHVYIRGEEIPRVSRQTLLRDRYLDLAKFR
jgi:imidazolonepropionase-like amidohydrolase